MTTTTSSVVTSNATKKRPDASATKKKSKKRRRKESSVPKPGEEGYKSPTQLRNARKRRAKQQKAAKGDADPSTLYIDNPKAAPVALAAKQFFQGQQLSTDFDIHVGPKQGWRTVAKLAVRKDSEGKLSIGLFRPNSHDILSVPDSPAHHVSINAAIKVLERLCNRLSVTPFDETTGAGFLRYVALNVQRSTGMVQVTLVWNSRPYSDSKTDDEGKKELDLLTAALMPGSGDGDKKKRRRGRKGAESSKETVSPIEFKFHSLWVHFNSLGKHSNAIFSMDASSWQHVCGPESIEESLELSKQATKISLQFPPNVFRQANLDAFTNIVNAIRKRLSRMPTIPTCLELYGGVGTIGLNVADLTASLVSSDENPFNKQCFETAATNVSNVSYESLNATDMVQKKKALDAAQLVLVDPPRKGLEDTVLQALCSSKVPEILVYVSCGFDAFQRDCKELLDSGNWTLEHAEGHLLFPGSNAIETLAFFTRSG